MTEPFDQVGMVLQAYFDGLHHSDTRTLKRVFHPQALYACATDGSLLSLGMADYFAVVDKRVSPASKGEPRTDKIVSIEFVGPVTALAKVECTIHPKYFFDLLTLVFVEERWQIISKVFHYELKS